MSAPPSDRARLEMFCALVDDYDSLASTFPMAEQGLSLGTEPVPDIDHWSRVVRAMVLRKFILGTGDEVHCLKVLSSLRACLVDDSRAHVVDGLGTQFERIAMWLSVNEGEGGRWTVPELIRDYVYGSLLHADYDRWSRMQARGGRADELVLWTFTADAESFVRRLRRAIRLAEEEHLLHPATD